jgi:FKBP-type peptidyl-prolyl cis-trans isomerase FklB
MQKSFTLAFSILSASMLLGNVVAQQTPASQNPSAPAAKPAPAPSANPGSSPFTTQKDKFSYALGLNLGNNLNKQSVPVNTDLIMQGLKDGLSGGKALMTEEEVRAVMMEVQNQIRKQMQEKAQEEGAANQKEGETFLAANKSKEGVVTLPSGLQYKILTAGTGAKPAATDSVVCNYRGTLINGKEFDSSYKRGQPATFPVGGVIKGWTEALQLMPVGSKWQLFIPSQLAYGERGAGADIGPNSTLIFEVELLSIVPKNTEEKKPDQKNDDKK